MKVLSWRPSFTAVVLIVELLVADAFPTIRIEGHLRQLRRLRRQIVTSPSSPGMAPGMSINGAIVRAVRDLLDAMINEQRVMNSMEVVLEDNLRIVNIWAAMTGNSPPVPDSPPPPPPGNSPPPANPSGDQVMTSLRAVQTYVDDQLRAAQDRLMQIEDMMYVNSVMDSAANAPIPPPVKRQAPTDGMESTTMGATPSSSTDYTDYTSADGAFSFQPPPAAKCASTTECLFQLYADLILAYPQQALVIGQLFGKMDTGNLDGVNSALMGLFSQLEAVFADMDMVVEYLNNIASDSSSGGGSGLSSPDYSSSTMAGGSNSTSTDYSTTLESGSSTPADYSSSTALGGSSTPADYSSSTNLGSTSTIAGGGSSTPADYSSSTTLGGSSTPADYSSSTTMGSGSSTPTDYGSSTTVGGGTTAGK